MSASELEGAPMSKKPRNPYQPFARLVRMVAVLLVLGFAAALVFAVFGHGDFLTGQTRVICVDDDLPVVDGGTGSATFNPGVTVTMGTARLCTDHPNLVQRVLNGLRELPATALWAGALILLWRLMDSAQRRGPFSPVNVGRLRFIGLWLIFGGMLAAFAEALARAGLVRTMYRQPDTAHPLDLVHAVLQTLGVFPWSLVIMGLGLITVARILKVGVEMQHDLEGTV
jgi:hypothetical protein